MTKAERQRRARNLSRRLTEGVAAISPPGPGAWIQENHAARARSDDFLDVLAEWGETRATVDEVRTAYNAAIDAWRHAAETFQAESLERETAGA